ncbi:cytochrome c oxidase assembly protein [Bacillus lacus]|uniref:Cytochrome c oxidase assembly protein n=1 Tax=Metabacillus lacus TaxID=1983721 RepID=A0A7X2LZM8_9BACI|nr:cytochrome c oxidase assembly protein [Metabacillus lacus]MRX72112.1 cytochrome c oxidase assembly protein [Metabacillus lacus]
MIVYQAALAVPFAAGIILYCAGSVMSRRTYKTWPWQRQLCWYGGSICALAAIIGPLADRAHHDFYFHMLGHLLLGMLAPLLMVLGAPMTLLFRSINTSTARQVTKLLKSWPARILTDPVTASLLNIGGLWLIYTTNVYALMHENGFLHLLIHFHVFAAGYLFTAAMIYIDPVSHPRPYLYRSAVLVAALAGHGILAKILYANPPLGVSEAQAQSGAMLMYYGGDAVDAVLIFLLCLQWYRSARPRAKLVSV